MENSKLGRINELAHIAKQRELTAEEIAERDVLRKEYIAEWRESAIAVLENTYVQTPDGKKHKLQKKNCQSQAKPPSVIETGGGYCYNGSI